MVKTEAPIVVGFCIYWGYLMAGTGPIPRRTNVYIHSWRLYFGCLKNTPYRCIQCQAAHSPCPDIADTP
jgi:hypothetical protein